MVNYLNILDVWNIGENGYEPKYNPTIFCLTTESHTEKGQNDCPKCYIKVD
jgi:hypothetical protein